MEWLRNLKIRQKELILITLMSIFIVLVGFTGYYLNQKESRRLSYLYSDYLLSIQSLDEIRVNTRANEVNIYRFLSSNNPYEKKLLLADIKHRTSVWNKALSLYLKTPMEPYESQRLTLLINMAAKLNNSHNKNIRLIQEGKREQAYKSLLVQTTQIDKFNDLLRNLAKHNINSAKALNQNNLKFAKMANLIILGTILLSLLLSIPLAFLIARLISDPLNTLVERMKEVETGNLNPSYAKISTSDEIGEVNNAFKTMTGNLRDLVQKEQFLRQIVVSSISSFDIHDVLRNIVIQTGKLFGNDRCFFIEYDENIKDFLPINDYEVYNSSLKVKDVSGQSYNKEELVPFYTLNIERRQPLIINNTDDIELTPLTRTLLKKYSVKSVKI